MFPYSRFTMYAVDVHNCILVAKEHFPVTDKTRVIVLNVTPSEAEQHQREMAWQTFVADADPASLAEIPQFQSEMLPLTLDGKFRFGYYAALDTLYIVPAKDEL